MALKSIQQCHLDPIDRKADKWEVTAHSDDGQKSAIFTCSSERAAIDLRNAIRENADTLRRVTDFS